MIGFDAQFAWTETAPVRRSTSPTSDALSAPEGWREGVSAFLALPRPAIFTKAEWVVLQSDTRGLAQLWAADLFALGWSLEDVFGYSPKPWTSAIEPAGVVRYLGGHPISGIDANSVTIDLPRGSAWTFCRRSPASSAPFDRSGALPIWTALSPRNLQCANV